MKKQLFTLLTLLLCVCSSAWAVDYYTPTADEVIILNSVYDKDASSAGYSNHSGVKFYSASAKFASVKAGDPSNGGAETSSKVSCFQTKNNGAEKQVDLIISGCSKVILYHEKKSDRYPQLLLTPSSGAGSTLSGTANLFYNEFSIDGTKSYTIRLQGYSGSENTDVNVYAVKLIKAAVAPGAISFSPAAGSVETGESVTLSSSGATTIVYQWGASVIDGEGDWSGATTYGNETKPVVPSYGSSNNVLSVKATNAIGSTYGSATYTILATKKNTTTEITAASISALNKDIKNGTSAGTLAATVTPDGESALASPTITWSSSDASVATIGENTGAVTLVGAGTTTITASYAGTDDYKASSDTYDLTVVDNRKSVTLAFSSTSIVDYNYDGETLTAPTLTAKDGEEVPVDIADLELSFAKTGDIVTVNSTTGAITAANINSFGSSTVTVSFSGNSTYKAATSKSYTVTRSPMLYQVKFDNGFEGFIKEGNKTVEVYYMAGTSAPSQTGDIKKTSGYSSSVVGNTVVLTKDTHTKTYNIVATAKTPFEGAGKQTFSAVPDYVASVYGYTSDKGLKFSKKADLDESKTDWTREAPGNSRLYFFVGAASSISFTYKGTERAVKVRVNGGDAVAKSGTFSVDLNNDQPNMIEIQSNQTGGDGGYKDMTLTSPKQAVTVGANGYTTFASTNKLDLTDANRPTGLKAYKATRAGSSLTFTALNQAVPAGTGLLLLGETKGGTYYIPIASESAAVESNALVGVTTPTAKQSDPSGNYYFVMKKAATASDELSFAPLSTSSAVTIPAGKAYIEVPNGDLTGHELTFTFEDATEGEVTGIAEVNGKKEFNGEYFNLNGQKVQNPTRGLYIVNGKKVIVK